MKIVDLGLQPEAVCAEAARLLVDGFDPQYGWHDHVAALDEVTHVVTEGFARAMIADSRLIGWIGGLPQYDGRVWELHPLVVDAAFRRQGVGRALVDAFETEAARRGAFTLTLGTDDKTGMTSLADVNLYSDIPGYLESVRDLGRHHPFGFYLRMGYVVTGVMPDANGPGRPDIYMSKRLAR